MTRILVVDNYDSFVYTIVGYLDQLGAQTVVVRNDAVPSLAERSAYDGVLISPGPGHPAQRRAARWRSSGTAPTRASRCSGSASATRRSVRSSAPR